MDVTANFFTKLRILAVNLEKETKYLDYALNNDYDHEEAAPMKILHELHSEVRNIKADLHKKLETLETENRENSILIRAFQTLHQKNSADLEEIEEHFQNYGYEPLHKKDEELQVKLMETETEVAENSEPEPESKSDEVTTPSHEKPSLNDPLRTPQLEDFGLGHLMFQSAWGVPECPLPSDPKVAQEFSGNCNMHSSTFQDPIRPKTPKRTLQLGDDMLLTPKMESFEIIEHTGCVNDFTLALYNKRDQLKINSCNPLPTAEDHPQKASSSKQIVQNDFLPCMSHQSVLNDMLDSPLPPVFCTPGLKIHKYNCQVPMDEDRKSDGSIPSPVLPNFETPWLKKQCTSQNLKNEGTKACVQEETSDELGLEEPQPPAMSSDNYFLNGYYKSPSPPPMMTNYEILLDTPKVPEMTTQIPSDVLKILSFYDANLRTPDGHKSSKENLTSFNLMTPVPKNKFEKENRK
ncbi:spindle and kinetochore-associated protein 3 isoform X2 [Pristis pectinata]|uniref:spindle and kinetochore-associated protein 3 isoform X2 n=1 Tax=Pristis pectinata TaxID=685728 RepID=UPI00223D59F2|nr:spindle and kinetochore-associated protein 3 isoform X2 [Pristis pectinata]